MTNKHRNKDSEENSSKYHTGKECIVLGCNSPAGTAWSDHWCWLHNSIRLDKITDSLEKIKEKFLKGKDENV